MDKSLPTAVDRSDDAATVPIRAQQNPSSEHEIVFLSGTRIGALKNVQLKPYATGLARRRSARRASGSTPARSADGLHIAPMSIYRFKWFASGTIQTLLTNHAAVRLDGTKGRHHAARQEAHCYGRLRLYGERGAGYGVSRGSCCGYIGYCGGKSSTLLLRCHRCGAERPDRQVLGLQNTGFRQTAGTERMRPLQLQSPCHLRQRVRRRRLQFQEKRLLGRQGEHARQGEEERRSQCGRRSLDRLSMHQAMGITLVRQPFLVG